MGVYKGEVFLLRIIDIAVDVSYETEHMLLAHQPLVPKNH